MSLSAAFRQLRQDLELTGLQKSEVVQRQQNLRAAISEDLLVVETFLTGSYVRQTLIGPLSKADVDIVVVLDQSYAARGPRNVLELVKRVLLKTYPRTPSISRNGQAVTIEFSDFSVDVVPAFRQNGGFSAFRPMYSICDSGSDGWIQTNPKRHIEISTEKNQSQAGRLVPCVKMLKAWNRTVGRPLRSFHIEVLAWELFGTSTWYFGATMGEDWINVRAFFADAQERLARKQPDPAGTGADVGAYLASPLLAEAISKTRSAHQRCVKAEAAAASGQWNTSHDAYRQVFGDYYRAV
jgi:hypothetical protein